MKWGNLLSLGLATLACSVITIVTVRTILAQQDRRIPLTAQITTTYYHYPSGQFVKREQSIIAVRSDGSSMDSRIYATDGKEAEQKSIFDAAKKERIAVDGLTESLTTYHMSDTAVRQTAAVDTTCSGDSGADHASLLGYDVVKITRVLGPRRIEEWLAPKLNCFALKRLIFASSAKDPSTVMEVRSIAAGEPDARFFSVPKDYVERSPSQAEAELLRRYPETSPSDAQTMSRADQNYYASRQASQ